MNYADPEYDHSSKGKVQVGNPQHLRTFSAPFQYQMLKEVRKRPEGAKVLEVPKMYFFIDLYINGNRSSDFTKMKTIDTDSRN
jgi:hypothetical protein